jgi:hypothetical protein
MSDASAQNAVAAAWFADPSDPAQRRWWDGSRWTEHVAPMHAAPAATVAQVVALPETQLVPVPAADTPLFPKAPTAGVRPSVTGTVLQLMRQWWIWITVATGLGGWLFYVGAMHQSRGLMAVGGGLLISWMYIIGNEAVSRVWAELFRARGLTEGMGEPEEWHRMCSVLPILQTGTSRDVPHWATGELRGFVASCGEFTITTGQGRSESTRNFLFAAFRVPDLAAARHPGVSVRERSLGKRTKGTKDGDTVEFESIEVNQRLRVRVSRGSDPVSTRELFGPQLVAALADYPVSWDQRDRWLLVYQDLPTERAKRFDEFCTSAAQVARAYWTDQR